MEAIRIMMGSPCLYWFWANVYYTRRNPTDMIFIVFRYIFIVEQFAAACESKISLLMKLIALGFVICVNIT